jgi:uncharacterized protein YceH (UPF0502 family)
MVKEVPPPPGSRARLYVQLLCPGLHPIGSSTAAGEAAAPTHSEPVRAGLEARVATLEAEVERLKREFAALSSR